MRVWIATHWSHLGNKASQFQGDAIHGPVAGLVSLCEHVNADETKSNEVPQEEIGRVEEI